MSIKLSPKHGVNPSMSLCYFCGEAKGVALLGRLPKDAEAPRQAVFDREPCDECDKWMEQGIILIEVSDTDKEYRMGGFSVVREEAIRHLVRTPELVEAICKQRVAFVPTSAYKMLIPASKPETR